MPKKNLLVVSVLLVVLSGCSVWDGFTDWTYGLGESFPTHDKMYWGKKQPAPGQQGQIPQGGQMPQGQVPGYDDPYAQQPPAAPPYVQQYDPQYVPPQSTQPQPPAALPPSLAPAPVVPPSAYDGGYYQGIQVPGSSFKAPDVRIQRMAAEVQDPGASKAANPMQEEAEGFFSGLRDSLEFWRDEDDKDAAKDAFPKLSDVPPAGDYDATEAELNDAWADLEAQRRADLARQRALHFGQQDRQAGLGNPLPGKNISANEMAAKPASPPISPPISPLLPNAGDSAHRSFESVEAQEIPVFESNTAVAEAKSAPEAVVVPESDLASSPKTAAEVAADEMLKDAVPEQQVVLPAFMAEMQAAGSARAESTPRQEDPIKLMERNLAGKRGDVPAFVVAEQEMALSALPAASDQQAVAPITTAPIMIEVADAARPETLVRVKGVEEVAVAAPVELREPAAWNTVKMLRPSRYAGRYR